MQIRENEQERTTLDHVALFAVDHAEGVRAGIRSGQSVLTRRIPAYRVVRNGNDITELVSGRIRSGFHGSPGDTLVVELRQSSKLQPTHQTSEGGGLVLDPGEKEGGGSGLQAAGSEAAVPDVDAVLLARNGILVQVPDGGGWRTVTRVYPREMVSECDLDSVASDRVRLVFIGRHSLGFVGRTEVVDTAPLLTLPLVSASHTRLGNVLAAISGKGGGLTELTPGDTLGLEFEAPVLAKGSVREWFLSTHGSYASLGSSVRAQSDPEVPPPPTLEVVGPNPLRQSTTLSIAVSGGHAMALDVFDVHGRRVRRLHAGSAEGPTMSIDWDGRDERGRRMQPGIYLARAATGQARVDRKLVLLP